MAYTFCQKITVSEHLQYFRSGEEARILAVTHRIRQVLQKEPMDILSKHQAQALEWILYQDARQLKANASEFVSRYALALLYYTTTEQGPWNYCNPNQTIQTR